MKILSIIMIMIIGCLLAIPYTIADYLDKKDLEKIYKIKKWDNF